MTMPDGTRAVLTATAQGWLRAAAILADEFTNRLVDDLDHFGLEIRPANGNIQAPPELIPVIAAALRAHGMRALYQPQGASPGKHTGLQADWPEPNACGACGWEGAHGWAWVDGIGQHGRVDPTDAQRLARMRARRTRRTAAAPTHPTETNPEETRS